MRRRNLLTGAMALGATAALGTSSAEAAEGTVEDTLFRLPSAPPVPLARLTQEIMKARADFRAAHYTVLGQSLARLLAAATATRDAATGHERERANIALARGYVLAAELALKQHDDSAWVAADRALTAARASGHPVPIGESSRVLAITMRRPGRIPAAVQFLGHEAKNLDTLRPQTGAVRTTLMLTAAYTAANGGDRTTALDLLNAAEEETDRWAAQPNPELFTVDANKAQVDVYRIGAHTALGTPDEAVEVAARLDIDRMPTAERRARAWTDTARMWHALGDDRQTFAALRHVEQEAPQEVRRPAVRALTSDLLYGPTRVPGIREFAGRTGASFA
ncbi:XRE family transcriptional regulator [Streptomyces albidoflavus]|uniref:XRE family transcriptional regulator n=1 Tax=Streptomyces albidoflavus TaxID=1886 RepID=UPI0033AF4BD3